jgi:hypothetical protein
MGWRAVNLHPSIVDRIGGVIYNHLSGSHKMKDEKGNND